MPRKVFYSWQSRLPNAVNRGFIGAALEAACKVIGEDLAVEERPEVDSDTQGVPGSPDIGQTIFDKIDRAAVFVCDVSIITGKEDDGPFCPNPNVLIELGYAIKALGWHQIILVMNAHFGGSELLPFDLKTKRVMSYEMSPDGERASEKKRLQGMLSVGLDIILKHSHRQMPGTEIQPASLGDLARQAIEQNQPNAAAAVRRFMRWLAEQIEERAPKPTGNPPDDNLIRAIEETKVLMLAFAEVAASIAEHEARDAGRALFKGFEQILSCYGPKPTFAGPFNRTDFDLWKFIGHEMTVVLVALLVRDERWDLLRDLLSQDLLVKTTNGTQARRFDVLAPPVTLLDIRKERLKLDRMSIHADILQKRYGSGELGGLLPFEQFMEADYLLFLRDALAAHGKGEGWDVSWNPWSAVFMEFAEPPRYLIEATRREFARTLAPVLGVSDELNLREGLGAIKPKKGPFFDRLSAAIIADGKKALLVTHFDGVGVWSIALRERKVRGVSEARVRASQRAVAAFLPARDNSPGLRNRLFDWDR